MLPFASSSVVRRTAIALCLLGTGCAAEASDEPADEGAAEAFTVAPSPGQDVFDGAGFTTVRDDAEFTQRFRIVDGGVYCETKGVVTGSITEAVKILQSEWTWYDGATESFTLHPNGHITQHLWPTGKLGVLHVTQDFSPAERLANGTVRISVALGRDIDNRTEIDAIDEKDAGEGFASGPGYIELRPLGNGRFELLGRFVGVRSNVLPTSLFATKHLEVEGGKVGFPFFRHGGGFAGFKTALARGDGR